jgi:hypothetical protein
MATPVSPYEELARTVLTEDSNDSVLERIGKACAKAAEEERRKRDKSWRDWISYIEYNFGLNSTSVLFLEGYPPPDKR